MEKTAQQLRFEAAWLVKWPNDEPRIFEQDTKGTYTWPEVQDTFDGWQLCEASALERAAVVEALEKFRTPYHSAIWLPRFFTYDQYNALRDLLLASRGEVRS